MNNLLILDALPGFADFSVTKFSMDGIRPGDRDYGSIMFIAGFGTRSAKML